MLLVLPALLLERLLRLFDLLAGTGGAAASIISLLLYLLPHYLGLALPAALFLAVYMVVARLSRDHELDALQALGFSLTQLSRPFLMVGAVCAVLGIVLYGYAQPLGRYAYRAAFHALAHAGWNATLVPGEFVRIGSRTTVYVERRDPATGLFHGIMVRQHREDGSEALVTAQTGRLLLSLEESELLIEFEEGQQITSFADGRVATLTFGNSAQTRTFVQRLPLFRARGADEREMTLTELRAARGATEPAAQPWRLDSEFHARLVRSASLLLLPLLAMPMGLAAKRSRHSSAIVVGALILVIYQQAVQTMESLGDMGRVDPRLALWSLFFAFAALSIIIFRNSNRNPHEGAFDRVLAWIDDAVAAVAGRFRRQESGR